MPYTNFTLNDIKKNFGVSSRISKLFINILPQEPSATLLDAIETSHLFSLLSEKEKSEALIFPVMVELKKKNRDKISIFSGRRLDVDSISGLAGECDFIISNKPDLFEVDSPIIALIEAKKDDFTQGVSQCVAQMIGSRMFNEQRGASTPIIYGCVTNAREWQFLRLQDDIVTIDSDIYYLNKISEVLGIFQIILDHYL